MRVFHIHPKVTRPEISCKEGEDLTNWVTLSSWSGDSGDFALSLAPQMLALLATCPVKTLLAVFFSFSLPLPLSMRIITAARTASNFLSVFFLRDKLVSRSDFLSPEACSDSKYRAKTIKRDVFVDKQKLWEYALGE